MVWIGWSSLRFKSSTCKSSCYAFFSKTTTYSFSRVAHSLRHPFKFFSLGLHPKIAAGHDIVTMIFIGSLPYTSRNFAATFRRYSDFEKKIEGSNYYFLRYSENTVSQLPPPYHTRCSPRIIFKSTGKTLKTLCLTEKLAKLNRSPFSQILTEGSEFKPVSPKDTMNETLNAQIEEIQNFCDLNISRSCQYTYAVTHAHSFYYSGVKKGSLVLRIMIPQTPSLFTTLYPKTTFFAYALYIMSSFGVWLGISATTLNPFTRLKDFKNKVNGNLNPRSKMFNLKNSHLGRTL